MKTKDLSEESIKAPATSNNSLNPGKNYINNDKISVKIDKNCLKQEKVTFNFD